MKLKRPPLLRRAVFDGYDYGLLLTYIEGSNRLLLDRQGYFIRRTEHPQHRAWRIPKVRVHEDPEALFRQLIELAPIKLNETLSSFLDKLDQARRDCTREAFTWGMRLRLAPLAAGGVLASGDYHPGVVAVYKRMHGRYLSQMRAWQLPGTTELTKLNLIDELGLADNQFEILTTLQELHSDGSVSPVRTSDGISIGGDFPEPGPERAEDEDCKDIFLASIACIERTAWTDEAINKALQGYSRYDYQPAGVRHLLRRNSALLADDMGLGKTRQAIVAAKLQAAGKPIMIVCLLSLIINWEREIRAVDPDARICRQHFEADAQWLLVNYERLGDFLQTASRFAVLVIDEVHRLKQPTALWTRHAFDIAAQIPYRYLLTGTPVLNRETELHTLLRLSGHTIGQMPLKQFCKQFTGSTEFRRALREQLSDWMLRRRKDVLPQLKGKQHQHLLIDLNAEQREQYDAVFYGSEPVLARIGKPRILLERFKLPTVVQLIQLRHCGGYPDRNPHEPMSKRQTAIDRFQTNLGTLAFIETTSAVGTGNYPTAANYVIFVSLAWTPALQNQA